MTIIKKLEAIEAAALGNDRLAVLALCECPELLDLLNYALSPDITFGLKQVPKPKVVNPCGEEHLYWWGDLKRILDSLASRSLTGNSAKDTVGHFLGACSPLEQKWTERIIKQDLRLGFGVSSVNEIWPGTIVQFKLPLAKQFKELKSLKGRWALQTKMDGGRVVARLKKNGGKVKLISRSGKEWKAFGEVKAALQDLNTKLNSPVDVTLDGEVVIFDKYGRMDFQAIQKIFHTDDDRPYVGTMKYVMFDYAEGAEYDNPKLPYERRFDDLKTVVGKQIQKSKSCLEIISSIEVVDPTQALLDATAVEYVDELGCDGAIIRRLDKVPKNKKTSDITKVKPFEDGEAVIVGKVEGNGWLKGSLGTMICRLLVNKKPIGPEFEIGTGKGLGKALRQELWDDEELAGKIVNFKYQRLSDDGVPIIPTYRAIRHPDDM